MVGQNRIRTKQPLSCKARTCILSGRVGTWYQFLLGLRSTSSIGTGMYIQVLLNPRCYSCSFFSGEILYIHSPEFCWINHAKHFKPPFLLHINSQLLKQSKGLDGFWFGKLAPDALQSSLLLKFFPIWRGLSSLSVLRIFLIRTSNINPEKTSNGIGVEEHLTGPENHRQRFSHVD